MLTGRGIAVSVAGFLFVFFIVLMFVGRVELQILENKQGLICTAYGDAACSTLDRQGSTR